MLFVLALLFAVALAQTLPQRFAANVSLTVGAQGGLPGQIWLDYANKGARLQVAGGLADMVLSPSGGQSTFYVVMQGQCQATGSLPWSVFPPVLSLPPTCRSIGGSTVNGVPTNGFTCPSSQVNPNPISIFLSTRDNSFVRVNGSIPTGPGAGQVLVMDFSNTNTGPISPSTFSKPASC